MAVRNLLITGGNSGIGLDFLRQLATSPSLGRWRFFVTGRSEPRLSSTRSTLSSLPNVESVDTFTLDLSSRASTERFAGKVREKVQTELREGLDVVVLNAGEMGSQRKTGERGWLEEVEVHHTNQSHMLRLLLPLLKNRGQGRPRVIFVSSELHRSVPSDTDELLRFARGVDTSTAYSARLGYSCAKWCQMCGAMYWRDRLYSPSASGQEEDVDVVACSPGFVPSTSLFTRSRSFPTRWAWSVLAPRLIPGAVSLEEGAGRVVAAVSLPSGKLREEGATGYLVRGTEWGEVEGRCEERETWELVVEGGGP